MKTCSKCKTEYPATKKFFSPHKETRDRLQSWCRGCENTAKRKRYKDDPNRWKKCHKQYYNTIIGHLRDVYRNIKQRCNNSKNKFYKHYGGRGIQNKFNSSDEFVDYVINDLRTDPRNLQIDRINNNGHYEPGNIRFVTAKVNSNNKRKRKDK